MILRVSSRVRIPDLRPGLQPPVQGFPTHFVTAPFLMGP